MWLDKLVKFGPNSIWQKLTEGFYLFSKLNVYMQEWVKILQMFIPKMMTLEDFRLIVVSSRMLVKKMVCGKL